MKNRFGELMKKSGTAGTRKLMVAVLTAAFGVGSIGLAYAGGNTDSRLERELSLGDRYLEDMDYEQAVAAYEDALAIDDKCVEAYLGLAETYVKMGDIDKAIDILLRGIEKTGSQELMDRLSELRDGQEQDDPGEEADEEKPGGGSGGDGESGTDVADADGGIRRGAG